MDKADSEVRISDVMLDIVQKELRDNPQPAKVLAENDYCFLKGLKSASEMNGRIGKITNFVDDVGRWIFYSLDARRDEDAIRVKPENLVHIAAHAEYKQGLLLYTPTYMYAALMKYCENYDDLPKFDILQVLRETFDAIPETKGVEFEDITGDLEDIQQSGVVHGMFAQSLMMKASEDAVVADGKCVYIARRTMLNHACFAAREAMADAASDMQPSDACDDGDDDARMCSLIVFFRTQALYCKRGSSLRPRELKNAIKAMVCSAKY